MNNPKEAESENKSSLNDKEEPGDLTNPLESDESLKKKPLKKKKIRAPDGEDVKPSSKLPNIRVRPPAVLPPILAEFAEEMPSKRIGKSIILKKGESSKNSEPSNARSQAVAQSRSETQAEQTADSPTFPRSNQISPSPSPPKPDTAVPSPMRITVLPATDSEHVRLFPDSPELQHRRQGTSPDRLDTEFQPLKYTNANVDPEHIEQVKQSDAIKEILRVEAIFKLIKNEQTLQILQTRDETAPSTDKMKRSPSSIVRGVRERKSASNSNLRKVKLLSSPETREHLQKYLPVVFFCCVYLDLAKHVESLLPYVRRMFKDLPSAEPRKIVKELLFIRDILKTYAELGEIEFFRAYLLQQADLKPYLNEQVKTILMAHSRFEMLLCLMSCYDVQLAAKNIKRNSVTLKQLQAASGAFDTDDESQKWDRSSPPISPKSPRRNDNQLKGHVIFIMTCIFLCTEENSLLISILTNMGMSMAVMLELMIEQKQEDRIISIVADWPNFADSLTKEAVLDSKLYKLLILYDKMYLIEVFNEVVKHPETRENTTLFHELCYHIESGVMVEGYCNVVTKISETFWDLPKLMIFFNALQALVFSKKGNWLAYIRNPLLFFITLVKFFKDMKSQLDYRDNAITKLTDSMMTFCQLYIENSPQESFLLNVFDFDGNNKGILDYAFEIADMNILQSDPVESLIEKLWNLQRHTMQNLSDFLRTGVLRKEIKRFSLLTYTQTFDVTIEDDDTFQLDFQFASNSNLVRILSEIFWPGLNLIIEMIFAVFILDQRRRDRFDESDFLQRYNEEIPGLLGLHIFTRISYLISIAIKTLVIKHMAGGFNYMAKFFNTMLFIAFLQMVIYPLFLWKDGNFMFLNITQMLFVMTNIAYISLNALALNQVGVYMRIFFRMTFVVLIFGTLSCVIITIIAYPIHTLYIDFTQQIDGQIYDDLNLYHELYQAICTLFEFTFGAVVFVRPYQEQNTYTYTLTFVMIIFSFFGNIMLANLLVAFLTSQFDEINRNAKYLTMDLQHTIIKAFGVKELDAVVSLPFVLAIPALPVMAFMLPRGPRRARCNLFLRKVIHVLNVFVPAFVFLNIKMAVDMLLQYLLIALDLFSAGFSAPINFAYLLSWIALGPFFLLKLFLLDNLTVCSRILDFSNSGETLTQYDLGDEARTNLVHTFNMMNRVVHHEIEIKGKKKLTVRSFLSKMHSHSIQEFVVRRLTVGLSRQVNGVKGIINKKSIKDEPQTAGESINMKYGKHDVDHSPQILERFVSSVGQDEWPLFLDLEFMKEKFKNNINIMNVHSLLGFDKSALDKASEVFTQDSEIEIHEQAAECNRALINLDERVDILTGKSTTVLDMLVQLDAAIPTPSDPNT